MGTEDRFCIGLLAGFVVGVAASFVAAMISARTKRSRGHLTGAVLSSRAETEAPQNLLPDSIGRGEWVFRLDGERLDIETIIVLFRNRANVSYDGGGTAQLLIRLPFTPDEWQSARDTAEGLISKTNAIARIAHGDHKNVRIAGIAHKHGSTGAMHHLVHFEEEIRVRSELNMSEDLSIRSADEKVRSFGDRLLAAADQNEDLERTLYLYGSVPLDWRGLYMVLEAIEDANGGEKGLIGKRWVPDGQVERFKRTANSFRALGLDARHGSLKSGVKQPQLGIAEAREMVRRILEEWSKEFLD